MNNSINTVCRLTGLTNYIFWICVAGKTRGSVASTFQAEPSVSDRDAAQIAVTAPNYDRGADGLSVRSRGAPGSDSEPRRGARVCASWVASAGGPRRGAPRLTPGAGLPELCVNLGDDG